MLLAGSLVQVANQNDQNTALDITNVLCIEKLNLKKFGMHADLFLDVELFQEVSSEHAKLISCLSFVVSPL